jgi:hypothetical protein
LHAAFSPLLFCGRSVFWALFGAIYLCFGLPEVYRVLFEVFGMDPDDEHCQPKLRRQLEDVDYVSAEFENKLNWQDIVAYKASYTYLLLRVLFIFFKISTSRSTYYAQLRIAPTC